MSQMNDVRHTRWVVKPFSSDFSLHLVRCIHLFEGRWVEVYRGLQAYSSVLHSGQSESWV